MTSTTAIDREIIPPSPTDIFKNLTVFIDPSLPAILALQLKALLIHNRAKVASDSTPDIDQVLASIQVDSPTDTTDQAGSSKPSRLLISNLKPRFDLTETTHVITNSIHLPEYIALGRWEDEAGNIISFSYQLQSTPNNGNDAQEESRPSPDPNIPRVHRSIYLVTPLWVTQCYDLNKLLPTSAYSPDPYKFLSGIVIALDSGAKLPRADVELIQACVQAWGGQFRQGLTKEVTHLICCDEDTRDYKIANKLKVELGLKIVLPHWFHHSVSFRRIISEKPFEFPSPEILKARSPSMSADCQHGINGLPGTKLPPIGNPIEEDPEVESHSHKKATEMAFGAQNVSTRPVSQGLFDYLQVTNPDSLEENPTIKHSSKLPQHSLKDTPAYREFQDKSVYLVSSLGLSLSARRTLSRRIEELGAKVFDGGDLKLTKLDKVRSDAKLLKDATNAEENLKNSDIVICECRAGWEFWLAWDQGKKIGTLHWILCILNNLDSPTFAIRPPTERLLDFPCPPGPITGCDPESKPITVTNYAGAARAHLIKLIEKMHMTFSGALDQNTFMVVAANKAGSKVDFANKSGIQIVNHHYIEDCFQNWSKQSIQTHHLTFPDGVNICELVGQVTRTLDGISKWTKRTEVKEQKKRDLSVLPSKLIKIPLSEISSTIPPEDGNPQPSTSTVLQQIDNFPQNPEASVAEAPTAKRVNRKPRLISDSTELSRNSASDILMADEPRLPSDSAELSSLNASDILKVAAIEPLESPRNSSSRGSIPPIEVNDRDLALITPRPSRQSPRKRSSTLVELDSNPSKKTKKGSNTDTETKKLDTTAPPSRASSPDRPGSVGGRDSSPISTPIQPKLTKSAKRPVSSRKALMRTTPTAPLSATRSSTRKAAQVAIQNVKSAAEDMNLHEKEKKKKRISGGPLIGMEDGGYFGSPKKPSQPASRKQSKDPVKREADEQSEAISNEEGKLPNLGLSKKKGKRASGESKSAPDDEAQSSDLESLTIKGVKKPKQKVKVEDSELDYLSKSISVDHLDRKTKSTLGSRSNSTLAGSSSSRKICITESGTRIGPKISNKLGKMGAKFIESTPSLNDGCTHLLTNKIARTEKFLSCIVLGCFIVDHQWAEECAKRNEFVDEEGYELKDVEGERLHKFELSRSLKIARTHKILSGFQIFLTPYVANQHSKLLKKLILLAGGQVATKIPPLQDLQRTAEEIKRHNSLENDDDGSGGRGGNKSLIVSCKEDHKYLKTHLIKKFPTKFLISDDYQNGSDDNDEPSLIKIFDSNLILQGLLVQEIKFEKRFVLDCSGLL
ncbi:hypothetical protein PGT21_009936 [Puccinia graminis f. sp. tritici]|uniref:BRCT domain-containing protein n=2 Tax=Puccinia graminis f. sp. tritici TaxID=56615 RepID=A0A5B0NMT8_PUCGR|nr:hypothetical protein PGT21_009936 [Puccinia graminis f. sp. tritici]